MARWIRSRIAPQLRHLSDSAIERGITAGRIAEAQGFLVPVLSGADPVLDALQHVSEQLDAIAAERAAGGQVDEEKERELQEQQRQLQELEGKGGNGDGNGSGNGNGATPSFPGRKDGESEIDYLRRFKEEMEERTSARSMVEQLVAGAFAQEAEKAQRMKSYAADALKEILGADGDMTSAVERIMKSSRPGSRFAGQGADPAVLETLGIGTTAVTPSVLEHDGGHLTVGIDREIKALEQRALPKAKGGDGLGLGQFIVLLNKHKYGVPSDAERRFFDNIRRKALAEGTPSAGGVLVPREYMEDLLGLLRAQAVVRRANPRIQQFNREMYQTSVSTGATAFYTQENAQIPISEETFAEAPLLTPKNLTALVPASNYLLNDAPAAEDFVRADLAEVLALREDLAFLRGTGTLGEPRGFRNIVGITLDPITPGGTGTQFTIAQLRRIRAIFRSLNAGAVRPTWFFNPEFLTYLETLEEMSGGSPTGRTLLDAEIITYDDDTMTAGRFDGIRFFSTTQLPNGTTGGNPTTELYLVNMAEVIVGENQELEIDISREASYWDGAAWVSAFQNNQSLFRAVLRHDIASRRPNQVIVQTGARTT